MKKIIFYLLILTIIIFATTNIYSAKQVIVTVQTPPAGTSWYNYFAGVAKAIELEIPEAAVSLEVVGSSFDNARCLQASKGNTVGGLPSDAAMFIFKGMDPFTIPFPEIRLINPGPSTVMQWVVRKDSGVKEFKDLENKRWNPGGKGSSTEKTTLRLLEMLNIKPDLRSYSQTDVADATINGDIIGMATAGAPPSPMILQLLAKKDIELLSLTKEQVEAFINKYPWYAVKTVPASTYKGVDYPVTTVGIPCANFMRKEDDPELVYRIVKALWARQKERLEICSAMLEKDPNGILDWSLPMHPGAIKYFEEIGIKIPDRLIPPEMKK